MNSKKKALILAVITLGGCIAIGLSDYIIACFIAFFIAAPCGIAACLNLVKN